MACSHKLSRSKGTAWSTLRCAYLYGKEVIP